MPLLTTGAGKYAAAAGGLVPTTLDPANLGALMTLDGTKLIATNNSGGSIDAARSIDTSTGKFYFEVTWTNYLSADGAGAAAVGIGNASAVLTTGVLGQTVSAGYRDDGVTLYNFTGGINAGSSGSADVVGIAVDVPNKKLWARVNGAAWDGNSDNPVGNVGGLDFTGLTGAVYAIVQLSSFHFAVTANFGATTFANAAPAGFGVLGH